MKKQTHEAVVLKNEILIDPQAIHIRIIQVIIVTRSLSKVDKGETVENGI